MSIQRLPIVSFLQACRQQVVLDVRSPVEYIHAHLPGAVNIPLFTNEERKVVGTTYKQTGREAAIKIGLDFFGPKMRPIVEEVEGLVKQFATDDNPKPGIFMYCWRGGMRSAAIAWLLNLYGFPVTVLAGGYKAFRRYALEAFTLPWSFKLLGGYTGSGKTELLQQLQQQGEKMIDLEALALHKGSAFGHINMPPQPSQEMFENLLALQLYGCSQEQPIWLEDECQRIGRLNIPAPLWQTIRHAPVYFIDVPFAERLQHIIAEYGSLEEEEIAAAILRIKKRLGGLETKQALQFLAEKNIEACFAILLRYYDKFYLKSLHNRESLPSLLTNISCSQVSAANVHLLLKPTLA